MAHNTSPTYESWLENTEERRRASPDLATVRFVPMFLVGIIVLVIVGFYCHQSGISSRFWHAYLIGAAFCTSISLGGLFFVVVQHLTGAHWGVVVRRLGEIIAMGIGVCGFLFIPIWLLLLAGDSSLYHWNDPALIDVDGDGYSKIVAGKSAYLNAPFFIARSIFYFILWFAIARYYFRASVAQDRAFDNESMRSVRGWAGPAMLAFALSINFASMDWMMTLRETWFSTIFGVYYFAGCAVSIFATLGLVTCLLQSRGVLTDTVTKEHYHDIGKLMFGFIVFWAYIAFSQFLLIWYADLPEETQWYAARQLTPSLTGISDPTKYLFLFHFFIPFLGLISMHVRRRKAIVAFWGLYMLVVHWFDLYYIVALEQGHGEGSWPWPLGLVEIVTTLAMLLMYGGTLCWIAAGKWLVPIRDPRLKLSLTFENH